MDDTVDTLPGFKWSCTASGAAYLLLALSTLVQGAARVLAPFGVPEAVLTAPHFLDFFHFVFVHMAVLGVLIILLGQLVLTARRQRLVARVLLLVQVHYLCLDVRTSTWGNGLYAHDKSLVPVFIGLVFALCFLYLSVRPIRRAPSTGVHGDPPAGIVERAQEIARTLGMHWDGLGGAHSEQLPDGRSVWRVCDGWGGVGGSAIFDLSSAELLGIEETPPERDVPGPTLPEHLVPTSEELISFARAKLAAVGWILPDDMLVERDLSRPVWQLAARLPPTLQVELHGRRRNLRVARAWRV